MDAQVVTQVLDSFPAFFRKSKNTTKSKEHYYTVHLRYARRKNINKEYEESPILAPEELSSLISLIIQMATQEQEADRLNNKLFWTLLVSILTAIMAAITAIIAATIKL